MTDEIKELIKKLRSAEAVYNHIAKENHRNRKMASEVLDEIKECKAKLAELKAN